MSLWTKLFKKDKIKNKLNKPFVALDIGTEWIKALVFRLNKPKDREVEVEILGYANTRHKKGDVIGGIVVDLEGVLASIKQSVNAASAASKGIIKPQNVILGIGGTGIRSATAFFKIQRESPGLAINEAEFANILQKIQWKSFDKIRKQAADDSKIRLIDARLIQITVDGYEVSNPLGFKGRELGLRFFNAYARSSYLELIETIISRMNFDFARIVAEPHALISVTGSKKIPEANAIFIDVGGSVTDIIVVSRGYLLGAQVLSFGGRNFTKRLSSLLGVNEEEAEVVKLKYSAGQLSKDIIEKIRGYLAKDIIVWRQGIALALKEFSQDLTLPGKILLSGGGTLLPGLYETLNDEEWFSKLSFLDKPQIIILSPTDIIGVEDEQKILKQVFEVMPVALAANAVCLSRENETISKILKRATKIL